MNVVLSQTLRLVIRSATFLASLGLTATASLLLAVLREREAMNSPLMIILLAAPVFIFGANLVGPEVASGSLILVMVRPISRTKYLVGRVLGMLTAVGGLYAATAATTLLTHVSEAHLMTSFLHMTLGFVNYLADALFVLSMFALFGSVTTGYFNIGCYFLWCILLTEGLGAIGLGLKSVGVDLQDQILDSPRFDAVMQASFMAVRNQVEITGLLFTLTWSVSALWLASICFSRRELKAKLE